MKGSGLRAHSSGFQGSELRAQRVERLTRLRVAGSGVWSGVKGSWFRAQGRVLKKVEGMLFKAHNQGRRGQGSELGVSGLRAESSKGAALTWLSVEG